jgi:2-polyprenyl-6-methoxyphenol hydroxylase-like FAD-dependent oxidoreductase
MAATWMARCGINCRIIDKRGGKVLAGHADGLMARTMEIFDSFGFADRVCKEASPLWEVSRGRIAGQDHSLTAWILKSVHWVGCSAVIHSD